MRPSPTPRRRSRAWIWLLVAVVVVLVGGLVAIITAPSWGTQIVRGKLRDRLSARLGAPVEIGGLDLSWGVARLRDVDIGGGEHPRLRFDEVVVELDASELWTATVVVEQVLVDGGRIEGERGGLQRLFERLAKRRADEPSSEEGSGHDLVPERLRLTDVWLVVHEPKGDDRDRRIEARMEIDATVSDKRARVELRDVLLDPGHGPVVVARVVQTDLEALRDLEGLHLRFPLRVRTRGLGAPVTDKIAVAGVDGWVEISDRNANQVAMDLQGGFSDTAAQGPDAAPKLWSASGRLHRDFSEGAIRVDMDSFLLGRVPQVMKNLPLVDSSQATVGGHLAVVFADGVARLEGAVSVEGLNVDYPRLARTVVRDIGFDLALAAEVDPASHRLVLHYADLQRRGVALHMRAEVDHPPARQGWRQRIHLDVPPVACQRVLDAIPAELVPSLTDFELDGEFTATVDLDADYAALDELLLDGQVGIWNCQVTKAPRHAAAERLARGFVHRVRMTDGRTRTIPMTAGARSFTPLSLISPHMVSAVLTTEDGGFWRHRGFLPSQIRVALQRNLAAGQIELGASTITMQMVKNVLLSHERTFSRKLQELFLTWYVETVLTKQRIMEIYLNGIEYGPGLYGITAAADHYFGKHPADLNPKEAVFLALMLPSPARRHAQYCQGQLSPAFEIKVARILRIMNERGKLSDLEYEVWNEMPLEFDLRARGDQRRCLDEIARVRSGETTQMALSGLLGEDLDLRGGIPSPAADADPPTLADRRDELPSVVDDPANADAPGRPAMDPAPDAGEPTQ